MYSGSYRETFRILLQNLKKTSDLLISRSVQDSIQDPWKNVFTGSSSDLEWGFSRILSRLIRPQNARLDFKIRWWILPRSAVINLGAFLRQIRPGSDQDSAVPDLDRIIDFSSLVSVYILNSSWQDLVGFYENSKVLDFWMRPEWNLVTEIHNFEV